MALQTGSSLTEAPSLWIIAGANGSGKSSAYGRATIDAPQGSIWIINPDLLSKRISEQEGLPLNPDANLESVIRIEAWLYASVAAHQTVGVETVLSTDKFQKLVEAAQARGFRVRLIYVVLATVELNIERVKTRVSKGGHDVDEGAIRRRRSRSFEQLTWFFQAADEVLIYDNSGAEPATVITKAAGRVTVHGEPIPELLGALEAIPAVVDALAEHRER